ncbi:hypothetical protein KQX54_009626 [Cotesia glomerata]|uniref:Uncharacterized protein n=1 Tax=Cotesia glomerata TaxID=32391 RepID=A0AAV7IGL4_COTGL|nr:hypothetical protein KQX54_014122 [Cotesia glomerata]KAH0552409.1 hypothetical protein KQX54_009626 [Cotesia glomerata]
MEAYFQHIYHTVGIEGNTMNLLQTRKFVETRIAEEGLRLATHLQSSTSSIVTQYLFLWTTTEFSKQIPAVSQQSLMRHRTIILDDEGGGDFLDD